MLDNVNKNLPIDITIPEAFISKHISSVSRNPDALMCMTKIRKKDTYLLENSLNMAILLANFAKHIGLNEEQVKALILSGFLLDIGKIKISDEILHKPRRLNDQE
jgi:HD-GYP domain-containing protein (c-di-GMP phosphodiesterase class II)